MAASLTTDNSRVKLNWLPKWEPEFSRYTKRVLRENMWRFDYVWDVDDAMQEMWLRFNTMCEYYPKINNPAQFMGVYKRVLQNFIADKACRKRDRMKKIQDTPVDATELADRRIGSSGQEALMVVLLSQLPEEIRTVLSAFDSEEFLKELRKIKENQNLNDSVCKILGMWPERSKRSARTRLNPHPLDDLKRILTA